MEEFDWLQQQEQSAWKAKIRQLRFKLSQERIQPQPIQLPFQELVSPPVQKPQKAVPLVEGSNASENSY